MRRWLVIGFMSSYLSLLGFGLISHAMGFLNAAHPLMYFIVWDMFCGWTPYNSEMHVIGEGESGTYYQLAPGPWGALRPWGALHRHHYDPWNNHVARMGLNVLAKTDHEPMQKIWVVEECYLKKYELAEHIWNARYTEPPEKTSYYRVRAEVSPTGEYLARYIAWAPYQNQISVSDNPRLYAESQKDRPMFMVDVPRPGKDVFIHNNMALPGTQLSPSGAPLGN